MNRHLSFLRTFFACLAAIPLIAFGDSMDEMDALYKEWHFELLANPDLQEIRIVSSNGISVKFDNIVNKIKANRFKMATFLCEKVAKENDISYEDGYLLSETAGMYWFIIETKARFDQDPHQNLKDIAKSFSEEWKKSKYADTSKEINTLCDSLNADNEDTIRPDDLFAMRRLGIFALPELIKQIKNSNSRHAFATFLIVCGDRERYAKYLENCRELFITKAQKMAVIKEWIDSFRKIDIAEMDLDRKITAAMAD